MLIKWPTLAVLLCAILGAGIYAWQVWPNDPRADAPRRPVVPIPCPFDIPEGRGAACYQIIVPRDRRMAEVEPVMTLFVTVFRAAGDPVRPDPVVYLHGGPGGPAWLDRDSIHVWWDALDRMSWLRGRDLVVLAQRGTPPSRPSLDCPKLSSLAEEKLVTDAHDREAFELAALDAFDLCWKDITGSGIDPNVFRIDQNAQDIVDVVGRLGYDAWNLYGVSFGTRLALDVARLRPAGMRSMILDSVYPPQATSSAEADAARERFLDAVASACQADAPCGAAYPEVRADIAAAVQRHARAPIVVAVRDPDSGLIIPLLVDGEVLRAMFESAIYDPALLAALPAIAHRARTGETERFESLLLNHLSLMRSDGSGFLARYIFDCSELTPYAGKSLGDGTTQSTIRPDDDDPLCQYIAVAAVEPELVSPVSSEVPTLLLSGELDWATPPPWADAAARTLPNGIVVRLPGLGHAMATEDACVDRLIAAFLEAPGKNVHPSCLDHLVPPPFLVEP